MKQSSDKFTVDAFDAPRRGRPPVAHPKTVADRQAAYRARQRNAQKSTDPAEFGQMQLADLERISQRLYDFCNQWAGVDDKVERELMAAGRAVIYATAAVRSFSVTSNKK